MPSKTPTEFYRNCPQCNKKKYYNTLRLKNQAVKRNLPCRSCSSTRSDVNNLTRTCPSCEKLIEYANVASRRKADKLDSICNDCRLSRIELIWTPEARRRKSEQMREAKLDPNSVYNTPESKKKVSDAISLAHKDPNSIWQSKEWIESQRNRNLKLSSENKHPFQHLTPESFQKTIEKSKITRQLPDSKWQLRMEYRRTAAGRQEMSDIMKISRAENPVFHTEEYKNKINQHLVNARKLVKNKNVSNYEIQLAQELNRIDGYYILNEYVYNIGPYYPDIINHEYKIIVEFYGDFIHANPSIYKEDGRDNKGKKLNKEIWEYDLKRQKYLESQGWDVIIVWEKQWKQNRVEVINRILTEANNKKLT